MKTVLSWVGLIYLGLTALAVLDIIDFHSCIGTAGSCPTYVAAKEPK